MKPMLKIDKLAVEFGRGAQRVQAVRGVSFEIAHGETVGLVGESGSGKSSLGRAVLQLIPVAQGSVQLEGRELVGLSASQMRPLRREVQMVFQDPSLNPRQRAGDMLDEVLSTHGLNQGAARGPRTEPGRSAWPTHRPAVAAGGAQA
jgi:ABC-type glutathione transport system ATPase component